MTVVIDPNPGIIDNRISWPVAPAGFELQSAFAFPNLFNLVDGDPVDTLTIDFVSPYQIDPAWLAGQFIKRIVEIARQGEYIQGYALYRGAVQEVAIPEEICFLGSCWTPPFAGQTVQAMYSYRLWIMGVPLQPTDDQVHSRGAWPVILAVGALIIIGLPILAGIVQVIRGEATFKDVAREVREILSAPGENLAKPTMALSWPLMAFGFAVVAAGIFLPVATSHIEAKVPVGPGEFSGGAVFGGGGGRRRP